MKKTKILLATLLTIALSSCTNTNQRPLFIVHIVDVSASAIEDKDFVKTAKKTCHAVVKASREKDLYSYITVAAEISPAEDPTLVNSRDSMHINCNKGVQSDMTQAGTFPCKAWDRTLDLVSTRVDDTAYIPVVVSHVQANEMEVDKDRSCTNTVTSLANKVTEQNGKILVAGSTNQGNTPYNAWLWETLSEVPEVRFISGNVAQTIENEIKSVRGNQ